MSNIDRLKEMMNIDIEEIKPEYSLPKLDADALDSTSNINKYMLAKRILEYPEINHTLKDMEAFDVLNEFDVDPYYNMAQWVVNSLDAFSKENEDTPQAISYLDEFKISPNYENLNDFSIEFLVEFTKNKFLNPVNDDSSSEEDELRVPPQARGWIEKMASKFGFSDLGFKDIIYLYLLNHFNQERTNTMPSSVHESVQLLLNEKAPPGMEGWIKSVKSKFKKQYGDDWEEVLYATAWEKFKEEGGKVNEGTGDIYAGADLTDATHDGTEKKAPKVTSKVKSDVAKRIKELEQLISDYKDKKHFYGEVKPAIFNARDALNFIMDKLNGGSWSEYKEAQMHFQKVHSPIADLFPPTLIKFLAYGNDGEESRFKPIED